MHTKKEESRTCDDCKICTMVEHCDRAFMRTPATCEDYELTHVTETADAAAEEKTTPEEIAREAVGNGFYSPNDAAYRVLGEPTPEMAEAEKSGKDLSSEERKESVVVKDSAGNVVAKYNSVAEHIAAMERAAEKARTLADTLAAAKPKTVIISGADVSPEEMAAFKFLNSATEPDSARAQAKLVGCVATPRGRVLVATGYGAQVHIVNAELFDFIDDVAYAVYKNKVGFAYVPCVDDDYSFAMVKACVEELDGDGVEMLFSAPKSIEDFIEWTYNAGKQGLPPFTFDALKKLAVFKTAWRLRIPDGKSPVCVFKNGDCIAKLLPMAFFNAQKNGEGEDGDEK